MDYSRKSELIGELSKALKGDKEEINPEDERVNFKTTTGTLEVAEEKAFEDYTKRVVEKDEEKELEELMKRVSAERAAKKNNIRE